MHCYHILTGPIAKPVLVGFAYLVLALTSSSYAAEGPSNPSKPNVVLFLVDDMGWMDCGVYGSQYYETPNTDAFAKRAMRFTNAYAQPLCSPSRASILSGQYTARHGMTTASGHLSPQPAGHVYLQESAAAHVPMLTPESKNFLEPSQVTLAEALKTAGYRTAHIGKWHIGLTQPYWPEKQGFDVAFHCHPDPGPPGEYFSPYGVAAEGTPTAKQRVGTITDGDDGEYVVDRQADEAINFIRSRSNDEPFFLNLWCYGVHGPWGHKLEYTKYFAEKQDPTGRQGNPIMASMLKSVDDCFGRILDELDSQGISDNTVVIFYSDNGGNQHSNVPGTAKTATAEKNKSAFLKDWRKWAGDQPPTMNTPLRDGKSSLYEGGTRVPLMWSWAGKIKAETTNESIVGPIDIYPTLIDLLGIAKPARQIMDGVSYANVLTGKGKLQREAFFNYHPHAGANRAGGVWVRRGDWKLLRWFGNPNTYELFNLSEDISESNNLAESQPEVVQELDALINRFLEDTGAQYPRPNPNFNSKFARPVRQNAADADAMTAWKQRGCTATLSDGILTVTGTGKPPAAFLGHATGKMTAPAKVKLRLRSMFGGAGKIDCLPGKVKDESKIISVSYNVAAGNWQEIVVDLKHTGPLGTMRLYLPTTKSSPIEIDQIDIVPDRGRSETWSFDH